jgi:hypothetical protein
VPCRRVGRLVHVDNFPSADGLKRAQQWLENCLLASPEHVGVFPGGITGQGIVDLEQTMRDGVALARLARAFEGEKVVPRIFTVSFYPNGPQRTD